MEQKYNSEVSIGFIYAPITTLGYGKRVGIWFSGCKKNCKNCMTPELKKFSYDNKIGQKILEYVKKKLSIDKLEGLTVSGGEPFEQVDFLEKLVVEAKRFTDDILVYTGYTAKQLKDKKDKRIDNILETIGVLVDGEYIDELNDGGALRGSANQNIFILNDKLREKYQSIMEKKRETELINIGGRIISIGIK